MDIFKLEFRNWFDEEPSSFDLVRCERKGELTLHDKS
jgi:hypothetical protein